MRPQLLKYKAIALLKNFQFLTNIQILFLLFRHKTCGKDSIKKYKQ